jgi:hypothetical protein
MSGFSEEDYNTLTQFINFVTTNAEFKVNIRQSIELYKYLNKIQTELLPKIQEHILEVGKVKQVDKSKGK